MSVVFIIRIIGVSVNSSNMLIQTAFVIELFSAVSYRALENSTVAS